VELSTWPVSFLVMTSSAIFLVRSAYHSQSLREVGWNAADNLAVEELDDLRTTLLPPNIRGGHALAVVHEERIGKARIEVSLDSS